MKKNMGTTDRLIRIIIAAIILSLYVMNVVTGLLGIILVIFAAVFTLTSIVSFCPLYAALGIKTCSSKKKAV